MGEPGATPDARLLAVPNFSEGRDRQTVLAVTRALEQADAQVLDTHTDPDHNRAVLSVAARPGRLSRALVAGAAEAVSRIDLGRHEGVHPRVGAVDVVPIVFWTGAQRGAACAEALVLGDMLGDELSLPVFLYGLLTDGRRTRADVRRGGLDELRKRLQDGELRPDFGPPRLHPTAGAALVGARPPLVAFNVELAPPATLDDAREIAARIREGGPEGVPSLRAIGVWLAHRNVAQVSTNVEDHRVTALAEVVAAVARHARPLRAELVGLAPAAAFEGFPADVPLANKRVLEDVLSLADSPQRRERLL
jgi:glutamate formiminotransferase/glutamate formiminotransferase/formiminotetrahydrofolate cyclodeaminase